MSFVRLDPRDVVVSSEAVSTVVWSTNTPTATTFEKSSLQQLTSTANYYTNVYLADPEESDIQFAIAYGDVYGYGEIPFNPTTPYRTPSSTIYNQMRNLILGDEENTFDFGGYTSEHFYAITMERSRYGEKLMPGTFELKLTNGSDSITIIDDSSVNDVVKFKESGRVVELVLGTIDGGVDTTYNSNGYTNKSGSYGWMLPDVGVILLNGSALDSAVADGGLNLGTVRGSVSTISNKNHNKVFDAIEAGASFTLRAEETITSNYIFCRARSDEFNYSTNPSMISGSTGDIRYEDMIYSPRTYATTIGIYNDNNDLLAVAKMSKPLQKDFTKEALVRIKLDF